METTQKINEHLGPVFEEVLPAISNAGIKYWVFGCVGVAGINGKYIRENQDIDIYVQEEDFWKLEPILKDLVEKHGAWDADNWTLTYSMLKRHRRPKFALNIKKVERFEVIPVYRIPGGIEFRVTDPTILSADALIQEEKYLDGQQFFSAPESVVKKLLKDMVEVCIKNYNKTEHIKEDNKYYKYIVDMRSLFPEDVVRDVIERFNKKADENKSKQS
jgi:hypothetical protein